MILEFLLGCAMFGGFILFSFLKGIQIGQRLSNSEKIETKNPIMSIQNHIEKRKTRKQEEIQSKEMEIMLSNIDSYDGTGLGQKTL